jgi:ketosteroid isomerase-like protein
MTAILDTRPVLAAPSATTRPAHSPDEAAIATIVESVATLADRREFDALEGLYAPEVRLDYTSLAGGAPEVVSPQALMTRWAGVLPGFDRTRHALSDVAITVRGEEASATARVIADHWLGEAHWQVRGAYAYELVREGGTWRITAHSFTVTGEEGSRTILDAATRAAEAEPTGYLVRQQARRVVMDFLTGLEDKDMARVNGVWAEDAVQEMPYAPANFPSRVVGREALIAQYAGWPQNAGKARFTDGIRFYPTRDPGIVLVEYHGVSEIVTTGRVYDQRYIGVFHVEDGKITLFREYFDPNVFTRAFALEEGGAFYERK